MTIAHPRPLIRRPGSTGSRLFMFSVAVLATIGCGDDEPSKPVDTRIDVPGEAATISEALALATSGDVIQLAPGAYELESPLILAAEASGVTLQGRTDEAGERAILRFPNHGSSGIAIGGAVAGFVIRGITVEGDYVTGILANGPGTIVEDCRVEGGAYCVAVTSAEDGIVIRNNLLVHAGTFGLRCLGSHPEVTGNSILGSGDCGIYTSGADPRCVRNLVYGSANYGVACFGDPLPELDCNCVFLSGTTNYSSAACDPGTADFHVDPLFCDHQDFALRSDSPCAEENNQCGRIGAVGAACAR